MREILLTQVASDGIQVPDVVTYQDEKIVGTKADLISSLYDVADAPEGWPHFLGAILQSLPGSVAAVVTHVYNRQRDRLWGFQAINIHFHAPIDGKAPASGPDSQEPERVGAILPPSAIRRLAAMVPPTSIEMAIEQPCLIYDYGARHAVIGLCDKDADTLSYIVIGMPLGKIWTSENQTTLDALLPHIAKIIRLRSLAEKISAKAMTADFVLNRLPIGVVTFCTTSSVPTLNLVADKLVRTAPELLTHLQKLAVSRFNSRHRGEKAPVSAEFVVLPEPLLEMFHFVVMADVPTNQSGTNRHGTVALTFFVVSANRHIPIDTGMLQRLFQLTYAEARIAVMIVNGNHIDEIARTLAISLNTVKTHLRHIFEKTNVERQADLIHLLLRASIAINSSS